MINIILSITVVTLLGVVAYLKSRLNISEYNLNNWRQTALKLNSYTKHNPIIHNARNTKKYD
tara:strand:- start:549 stop:734 length:186 start_codon:yes stop_codon:yes gene_type:complete